MPIEAQIGGDFLHGRSATRLSDVPGESLRVMGIRAQPVEALLLHAASWATRDASQVEGEIDAQVTARQIAYATRSPIIPRARRRATRPADRLLARRVSVTTRAFGSPSTVVIVRRGVNPGTR